MEHDPLATKLQQLSEEDRSALDALFADLGEVSASTSADVKRDPPLRQDSKEIAVIILYLCYKSRIAA